VLRRQVRGKSEAKQEIKKKKKETEEAWKRGISSKGGKKKNKLHAEGSFRERIRFGALVTDE